MLIGLCFYDDKKNANDRYWPALYSTIHTYPCMIIPMLTTSDDHDRTVIL